MNLSIPHVSFNDRGDSTCVYYKSYIEISSWYKIFRLEDDTDCTILKNKLLVCSDPLLNPSKKWLKNKVCSQTRLVRLIK